MHGLDAEAWKKVDVVYIDIADRSQVEPKVNLVLPLTSLVPQDEQLQRGTQQRSVDVSVSLCVSPPLQDYKPEEDPSKYKSVKTSRGPLGPDWKVQSP